MSKKINVADKIQPQEAFQQAERRAPSYVETAELFGYKSNRWLRYGRITR